MTEWFDIQEMIRRMSKYIIEAFIVFMAAYAVPAKTLHVEEIALIALTAAATFAMLDTYLPSWETTTR